MTSFKCSEPRHMTPVQLLIDSSRLSVHVGQRRTPPNARDYRTLHLAVDEHTGDVVACELTSKRARDASRVASLVGQIERPIASATADAAYEHVWGNGRGTSHRATAGAARWRRRSIATRPSWAQRCERGDWRPRESR